MKTLKGITGNLAIINHLVIEERNYTDYKIRQALNNIDDLVESSTYLSPEDINALDSRLNKFILKLEEIRDNQEAEENHKEEINYVIQRLQSLQSTD
jgi:uncharacterized protein YfkK (UPF0435 family)